jgi:hypothetical protein
MRYPPALYDLIKSADGPLLVRPFSASLVTHNDPELRLHRANEVIDNPVPEPDKPEVDLCKLTGVVALQFTAGTQVSLF